MASGRRERDFDSPTSGRSGSGLRIGIDTGGTFTDAVILRNGRAEVLKLPSTRTDPGRAVVEATERLRSDRPVDVIHGTTVGLNALLQRKGERTALVTNVGFRDLVEIGRQERPDLYALEPERTPFPIPRRDRFTLDVRRGASGDRITPLDDEELEQLAATLTARGLKTVAVCLLHAPTTPADERKIGRVLRRHGLRVSLSHEVLPRLGEFERSTATAWNASLLPIVGGYLDRLERAIAPGRLRLLRNVGGILGSREAARFPLRAVFSGLAGGLSAASRLGAELGIDRLATLDMGGTSTDVALVQAAHDEPTTEPIDLAGLPFAAPTLDLQTIGCGGGSIARIDAGGALRVGPESAGSDPGPACYGRSSTPTVTDAHVALGHLGAETLTGSGMTIEPERSLAAIGELARRLGCSARRCAEGVLEVADVEMARALGRISSERAVDPAQVRLLAFGGAGPLHAARLSARAGFAEAIVPSCPGVFSAVGLALAVESDEVELPVGQTVDARDARLGLGALLDQGHSALQTGGSSRRSVRIDAVCRYQGQGHGLRVGFCKTLAQSFERLHRERYGFSSDRAIELVSLTFRRTDEARRWPRFPMPAEESDLRPRIPPVGGEPIPRVARGALERSSGRRRTGPRRGPLLIEEPTTVTWIPAGFEASLTSECLVVRARSVREN